MTTCTYHSTRLRSLLAIALLVALTPNLAAQKGKQQFATRRKADTALGQLSAAFQSVAGRVNASVVKIVAVGYRPLGEEEATAGISARTSTANSAVRMPRSRISASP